LITSDNIKKLGRTEAELERIGALWTAREIAQQPAMLRKTHEWLIARKGSVEAFLLHRRMPRALARGALAVPGRGNPHH
jgi:hypothetical protein